MRGRQGSRMVLRVAVAALALLVAAAERGSAQDDGAPAATLAAEAEEARLAGRGAEAIGLYRKALHAQPAWAEGWWHLGILLYEADRCAEAATAFQQATSLNPGAGTAWVMLGLCEFRLGRHGDALAHIRQGRTLGASADAQFKAVMLYHEGLLQLGKAEFERAQEPLDELSADGVEDDELLVALGMAVLRVLPSELPAGPSDLRELLRRAGRAQQLAARKQFADAEREYQRLALDALDRRNVHYALGRHYVAARQPDKAVAAFEREIAHSPGHVPARLSIAAIKAETDHPVALKYAEEAVRLNPRIPLGHYLLGRLLLRTDDIERAIAELETAERDVRDDPGLYYALGRAYARAGRTADAERARATFLRLSKQ